jgi:uncharacterized RDD family membrane protein YckC
MNEIFINTEIQSQETYPPAPIGPRIFALLIDRFVLFILGFMLAFLAAFLGFGSDGILVPASTSILIDGLYAGYFYSKEGATPGKKAMGLTLVTSTGNVTFFQGALRDTVGKWISGIILMIGFLMALFREDGRALHDLMFNTRVVSKD